MLSKYSPAYPPYQVHPDYVLDTIPVLLRQAPLHVGLLLLGPPTMQQL